MQIHDQLSAHRFEVVAKMTSSYGRPGPNIARRDLHPRGQRIHRTSFPRAMLSVRIHSGVLFRSRSGLDACREGFVHVTSNLPLSSLVCT